MHETKAYVIAGMRIGRTERHIIVTILRIIRH